MQGGKRYQRFLSNPDRIAEAIGEIKRAIMTCFGARGNYRL
jgi:hypothetical protein